MKIAITMTKGEKNRILDQVLFDPCEQVECKNIECEQCPLHSAVVSLRKAMDKFDEVVTAIPEEKDE